MSRPRAHVAASGDAGFTLVEMLVYCVLVALVLPLAGIVLVDALRSQRDVQAETAAGTAVQATARSLELGVRNASALSGVYYRLDATGTGLDQFFVARTREPGSSAWRCRAWYYDGARDLLVTRSAPAVGTAPVIPVPAATDDLGSWTQLAADVVPVAPTGRIFVPWTTGVLVDLRASGGAAKPVELSTAITQRPQWETGSAPCF